MCWPVWGSSGKRVSIISLFLHICVYCGQKGSAYEVCSVSFVMGLSSHCLVRQSPGLEIDSGFIVKGLEFSLRDCNMVLY